MHIERFLRNSRDYLRDPQSGADLWRTPQPNRPEPCRTWPLPSAPATGTSRPGPVALPMRDIEPQSPRITIDGMRGR